MLFDRSGTKTTYGALIDVASGTIGIAIVASDAVKKLPEIIYENRIDMRVGKRAAAEIRRVREMLLSASLSFSEGFASLRAIDPRARVSSLSVTVAAPWSYTVTNAVEYKDDAPFKITPTMLRDLVDSAEATILEGMRKDPDAAAENLEIIERVTTNVTVNDYPVPDPLKVEGTSLALSHVVGLVPRDILTSVHEIQDKLFQGTTLRVHTSMCTLFAVAEELYPRLSSFCLVNVSGEATEFGIATEGTLTDSIFIPKGTNGFMKKVMEDTGRPLADVESALRAFGAKDAAMASDLEAHLSDYTEAVDGAIRRIVEKRAFPMHVILAAQYPFTNLFTHAVTIGIRSVIAKKPTVTAIERRLVEEIGGRKSADTYLALEARFFHKYDAGEKRV